MEVREVQVTDMMDARERRAFRQRELLSKQEGTLICFTMNIAGPVKNSDLIQKAFEEGLTCLSVQLKERGIPVAFREVTREFTGNEAFLLVKARQEKVKEITAKVEDGHPLGRLFDMDVLDGQGNKVERQSIGLEERSCLICGGPVRVCASRRLHSVEELQEKTRSLIEGYFAEAFLEKTAGQAVRALLYEVSVSPKPGLVDRLNNGSHQDMDFYTFIDSAVALLPYFKSMVRIGQQTAEEKPEAVFDRLQYEGIRGEHAMRLATGNVNTHKGAVFSLGILCGAVGRIRALGEAFDAERILRECGRLVKPYTEVFFAHMDEGQTTAGCRFYREYGLKGVRGEAADGFPSVRKAGLPMLKKALEKGCSNDEAGGITLLHLLLETADTNLIARSDYDTYSAVKKRLRELLEEEEYPNADILKELDAQFIRQNLSPGGAADLLAICWFLYFMEGV